MSGNRKGMTFHQEFKEILVEDISLRVSLYAAGRFEWLGDQIRQKWPECLEIDNQPHPTRSKIPFVRLLSANREKGIINVRYGKFEVKKLRNGRALLF